MRSICAVVTVAAVLLLVAGGAIAAEKPLFFYGGLGYAKALNDGAPGGSIGLHGGLIYKMNGPFALGGEVGYLMLGKETSSYSGIYGNYEAKATWSTIPITGQVYYMPSWGQPLDWFLTGGLGFYSTKIKFEYSGDYGDFGFGNDVSDTNTDVGINLGAGFKKAMGSSPFQIGADGRFHIIMTENESTKVLTLMARIYY